MRALKNDTTIATGLLSLIAGITDAFVYQLSAIFPANMTGNFVVFAIDISKGHVDAAFLKLVALLSFVLGIVIVYTILYQLKLIKNAIPSIIILHASILVALSFCFIFTLSLSIPVLIICSTVAMGIQGAFAEEIGISTPTLVLTGNITKLFSSEMAIFYEKRGQDKVDQTKLPTRQLVVCIGYFAGAALSVLPKNRVPLIWLFVVLLWLIYYFKFFKNENQTDYLKPV
ncbi:YoaK family protein [Spirosoma fluviale]|uniref:Uncharacterized membrane protein YoaK, UPF0700 family n=1 Tax=Spirosoma fluviale TaxID=1597977 RepID=A0A286GUC1_9BACT|nr:YoaK family protein [Spirosoma fluviale]SOD99090.1 Uncharacterized membrane protein YoaK, UPF0700 family [Spirosoma fluviale]